VSDAGPISGRNFTVKVTERGPRGGLRDEWDLTCSQVALPVMPVVKQRHPLFDFGSDRPDDPSDGDRTDDDAADTDDLLVLRRGHTGSTELFDWWELERSFLFRGWHDIEVVALDDDGHGVTTWGFTKCHLVALRHSALDALESHVLTETAEISWGTVTQMAHR